MAESQVTLVGRIGQEPVTRATPRGDVVEFSVAVNERTRGPDGQWADGYTSWFRVSAWGVLGRNVAASLHRGHPVVVRGTLRVAEWGPEGQKTRNAEVRAAAVGHDLTFGTAAFSRGGASGGAAAASDGGAPALTGTPSEPRSTPAPAAAPPPEPERVPERVPETVPAARPPAPAAWGTSFAADEAAPF